MFNNLFLSLSLPTVAMLTLWPILFLLLCDKKWILLLIKICLLIRQQIFFNSVSNTMVRAPRFDKIYHHILFTVNVNNPVANFSFSNEIYYLGATILREWNTKKNAFPFLLFNCRIRLDSREWDDKIINYVKSTPWWWCWGRSQHLLQADKRHTTESSWRKSALFSLYEENDERRVELQSAIHGIHGWQR